MPAWTKTLPSSLYPINSIVLATTPLKIVRTITIGISFFVLERDGAASSIIGGREVPLPIKILCPTHLPNVQFKMPTCVMVVNSNLLYSYSNIIMEITGYNASSKCDFCNGSIKNFLMRYYRDELYFIRIVYPDARIVQCWLV